MTYRYRTSGVCSRELELELDGEIVTHVEFVGGCHGNLQGLSRLVEGMQVNDVIDRLEGIRCGNKQTSCPAQLCNALRRAMQEDKKHA